MSKVLETSCTKDKRGNNRVLIILEVEVFAVSLSISQIRGNFVKRREKTVRGEGGKGSRAKSLQIGKTFEAKAHQPSILPFSSLQWNSFEIYSSLNGFSLLLCLSLFYFLTKKNLILFVLWLRWRHKPHFIYF